jgi:hypothetical protein
LNFTKRFERSRIFYFVAKRRQENNFTLAVDKPNKIGNNICDMSTLQSTHQYGETSRPLEIGEKSQILQTQRSQGRKAKKRNPTKYRDICSFCSKEFICESRNQKYCRHECYAEHRSITKANPYKNLECISCLSILGFGCKAIARRLWKTNYASIRKVIRDRQLPRSNSKRAANREFENGRQNVLLDHEKKRRETIKRIDENLKVIRRLKKKCQIIMEAQRNCPYKIDWRNQSWQSVVYWANLEKERARSRESAKSRVIVKGSHLHIKRTCSNMLWRAIKLGYIKKQKTMYYFGCSVEQLKADLQSKFQPGMTWDNHGPVWEVDHIVPCDSFDLTDDYQVRLCNHYTNLQPLLKHLNRRKHAKFSGTAQLQIL